ncbi:MAG TPA: tRNA lysidine(34) synthetase TilS [Bacteroidales bacterium]|nr:tRNA lysidine(34) synthetase TilS [Bacteroidales bacterium]
MKSITLNTTLLQFIEENKLFTPSEKLLLAFSGGIDSVVLAHLLFTNNFKVELAHCNFTLRGKESDNDEQFAVKFAHKLGIPIYTKQFDTKKYAQEQKLTIQEAARHLRYRFFEELAMKWNFNYILTAHHLDDNIETLFINLLRGTGIKGLCGIPLKNNLIIRPLLFATREQITQYAISHNLTWREDSSNLSDKYTRNFIRHHIIPLIKAKNKHFYSIFSQNIQRINNSSELLNYLVADKLKPYIKTNKNQIIIELNALQSLPYSTSLLYHFAQNFGFNFDQIQSVTEQKHQSGKIYLSATHKAYIDRNKLIIIPLEIKNVEMEHSISSNTKKIDQPITLFFKIHEHQNNDNIPTESNIAYLDASKINFPLTLRKWKAGDRFYPLGMKQSKKVSDFLTDLKMNRYEKENTWVLCSSNQIVWIIGHRIDNRYKITKNTTKVLEIKFKA